jgi:DNA-binding MarR family transcriptional regulator
MVKKVLEAHPDLSSNEKLVILLLQDGPISYGNRKLGELLGVNEYRACTICTGLQKKGLVRVTRTRQSDGRITRQLELSNTLTKMLHISSPRRSIGGRHG